jgi:surface protein
MKQLKEIIFEKLKVNSKTKINQYTYHPKDKKELIKLLNQLIEERGYDGDFNDIDTSKITNMSCLFTFSRNKFNGDISQWDVSNVTNMSFMFCDTIFNKDISDWDVSSVDNMYNMFYNSKFNHNLDKWDVSKVKDMRFMFDGCPLEKNPPKWYHE